MFLAEDRRPAALNVEGRVLCTEGIQATLADDVHHAVISVLPAVHRCLAAHNIEHRLLHAGVI